VIACIFTIQFVAYLHTKTPKGYFGASLLYLNHCYIYLFIRPLLGVTPIPCTVNLTLCHAPVWLLA